MRPGWQEDARALAGAIGDESVVRNLAAVPFPYSVCDAEAYLRAEHDPLLPRFLIFSRTHGAPRLVGGCGVTRQQDDRLELGYWIARPYWGLGFATEAARATMRVARASGLRGIAAWHMTDNPASGHVLRKIGFRPTGAVEERYSAGRQRRVPVALFAEGESVDMPRDDLSRELYDESQPLAA